MRKKKQILKKYFKVHTYILFIITSNNIYDIK